MPQLLNARRSLSSMQQRLYVVNTIRVLEMIPGRQTSFPLSTPLSNVFQGGGGAGGYKNTLSTLSAPSPFPYFFARIDRPDTKKLRDCKGMKCKEKNSSGWLHSDSNKSHHFWLSLLTWKSLLAHESSKRIICRVSKYIVPCLDSKFPSF